MAGTRFKWMLFVCLAIQTVMVPVAAGQDPIVVNTFDREFINWANTVVDTFTFPEPNLYQEILCHMQIACPPSPGDCDPWDRFGKLSIRHYLNETEYEDYEIARFITPYDITFGGGPQTCSWTLDVTDYQFLLHDDVTLLLYIESYIGGNMGWLMTISFEMTPGEPEREPFAVQRLWRSGYLVYGDPDNPVTDHVQPVTVQIPEAATWAKFRAFSTGHGFWNTDNAAEFSMKWQEIQVDASAESHVLWRNDCAENRCQPQLGTWQYDRAGWCPGDGAPAWDVEVTDWVDPGESSIFNFAFQPYENWCRPNNPDCVDATGCTCDGHAYYKFEGQVVFYRVPNITAVEDGRLIPASIHLVGNYPNPFNPQTTIKYHLAGPGKATISVFDPAGEKVVSFVRDHERGGTFDWTWTGRDSAGLMMPSGVYLYEIRYGQETVSAKMMLLK
jgi:hypothetical protein